MKKYILALLFIIVVIIFFSERPFSPVETPQPISKIDSLTILQDRLLSAQTAAIFWEKRLKSAKVKPGEFRLVVNLSTDSVYLEIKSIILHSAHIKRYMINDSLHAMKRSPRILNWLRRPFILQEEWASVNKQPVRLKDISDWGTFAENLDFTPTDVDTNDVFVLLRYSNDLSISLCQEEPVSDTNPLLSHFAPGGSAEGDSVLATENFESLDSKFHLRIEIPQVDILAMFRALPPEAILIFQP